MLCVDVLLYVTVLFFLFLLIKECKRLQSSWKDNTGLYCDSKVIKREKGRFSTDCSIYSAYILVRSHSQKIGVKFTVL